MEFHQVGYTGLLPEKGYVGFLNIEETVNGVRFTVRSAGENPVLASIEIDIGSSIEFLNKALNLLCDKE